LTRVGGYSIRRTGYKIFFVTRADATEEINGQSKQLTQCPRLSGVASLAYSRDLGAKIRGSIVVADCRHVRR
jgi:hypothetical protein